MLPIYKNIYAIIGDEQSIQYNLSTFSSYITQLTAFLSHVGTEDLVLLDELGSGTDPVEGAALAQSVTEYLQMQGVPAIITSHFSEMKKLAYETRGIENAFVEFDEETLTPTYHLIIGVAGNSNAFSICKRLGMPPLVLSRASQLKEGSPLHNMEEVMARLNRQTREVAHEKEEVEAQLKKAEELRNELKTETDAFYKKKDQILEKTRQEAETIKRDLRNQSEALIKDLKKKASAMAKDDLQQQVARGAASVRTVHTTLNVIGKTVDQAVPEVDRFLNECFMAGVSPVQIIHGKGTGALRQGIQEYLRTLNFVKEFHEADYRNGGAGVTEVFF